ncbi:hypothetical protein SUGI_0667940 [Cryptomeria japonica]|nr:hypothetical protein SUGI_0667940 [Cryptomeria japonica]
MSDYNGGQRSKLKQITDPDLIQEIVLKYIAGSMKYVGVGDGYSALGLFREMMHLKEIGLDFGCFAGGLRACGLTNGLLQDVYSAAGRMDGLVKVKKMMKERMLPKIPLRSILQVSACYKE